MCGRYSVEASKEELIERYQLKKTTYDYEEKKEVFPANVSPIILPEAKLVFLAWGFSPGFAKRPLINARGETVLEKPTFSKAFKTKRCLVPATSFFEWEKTDGKKEKRRISIENKAVFSMAGICDFFLDENGQEKLMYSIITTEANEQMKSIHDRMPVILNPENEGDYLNLKNAPEKVQQLLKPYDQQLIIERVEKGV